MSGRYKIFGWYMHFIFQATKLTGISDANDGSAYIKAY
jgi:hypothetical protein